MWMRFGKSRINLYRLTKISFLKGNPVPAQWIGMCVKR